MDKKFNRNLDIYSPINFEYVKYEIGYTNSLPAQCLRTFCLEENFKLYRTPMLCFSNFNFNNSAIRFFWPFHAKLFQSERTLSGNASVLHQFPRTSNSFPCISAAFDGSVYRNCPYHASYMHAHNVALAPSLAISFTRWNHRWEAKEKKIAIKKGRRYK